MTLRAFMEHASSHQEEHGVPNPSGDKERMQAHILDAFHGDITDREAFVHACERYEADDLESAIDTLKVLLAKRPLHLGAIKLLGYSLYRKEEFSLASSALLLASILDGDDAEPPYMAACCFRDEPQAEVVPVLLTLVEEIARRNPLQAHFGERARQLSLFLQTI